MFWPKQLPQLGFVSLLLCLLHLQNTNAFVVPEELQSLLSVVYSNIPPIKKGTDSRIGFGYRLGNHADFQVMFELGPQRETRPLGTGKNDQSFNKRHVSADEQREQLRQQALWTSTERNAASWLENWSNGMKPKDKTKGKPRIKQNVKDKLPVQLQIPSDAVQQLQQLYKMATTASTSTSTSTEAPSLEGGSLKLESPSGFKLPPPALTQDTNSLGTSTPPKSRADITKDLMNVSLEA
ncbi:hypothetical protein ACLKA7_004507 [Drosophila subpalustris]